MAILAMDQYGLLLADLTPGAEVARTVGEARACLSGRGVTVLLPAEPMRRADPLPHSWSVTSDSVAAWLTRRAGARLLVLLKDRHGMASLAASAESAAGGVMSVAEMAASTAVDGHFGGLVADADFDVWAIDGERPERLDELLDTGRTEGIRLAR
jgi:dihydroneopterin aldolase